METEHRHSGTGERGGAWRDDAESGFELSEVLSALSYVLDMIEGQPPGHTLRSCFIGMRIGECLGLGEEDRSALFYALLSKDTGCSSNASRVANLFGADDFAVKKDFKVVDWSRFSERSRYAARNVSPDGGPWSKLRHLVSLGAKGQRGARQVVQIRCEQGAGIVRLLGFPEETAQAVYNLDEHWDGAGHPHGLRGEEIPLLARICGLAQTVEVFYTEFGPLQAEEMARTRRKKWFDPNLVDAFLAEARGGRLWKELASPDLLKTISRMEPPDRVQLATPERLDDVAYAFARIIDAKSPFTYKHSDRVASVTTKLADYMGFSQDEVRDQRRAALLHDIGTLGISNRILDKPTRLTDEEFEKIKGHTALTYGILVRVSPFRHLADLAASHHERLDGSGYHRGLSSKDLDTPARILAVADVFDALSSQRPYRSAMPLEKVFSILESDGHLDLEIVEALRLLIQRGEIQANA